MQPRAYITGINGQDGILLSKLLLSKGYEIGGCGSQPQRSRFLPDPVQYWPIDITDTKRLTVSIRSFSPQELYNFASYSSVAQSFVNPALTRKVNFEAINNLLYSLQNSGELGKIRIFQASSSEMFGLAKIEPQSELVEFNPLSPYAESKVDALRVCRAFRDSGFFVSSGIMFNHESIYRPNSFITRKVSQSVAAIRRGKINSFKIGNIYAERDWGFAGDFVEAIWRTLKHTNPDDYVIATGVSNSVKDLLRIAFDEVGLGGKEFEYLELDVGLLRPSEVNRLVGNASKAKRVLGWQSEKDFETLIREMVQHDLQLLS